MSEKHLPRLYSRGSVRIIESKHLMSRARQQAVPYPPLLVEAK
jgi:hypothetical protein